MSPVEIERPYLLFVGDVTDPLDAKTATGIAHWRRDWCLGQFRLPGCAADTGLPDLSLDDAVAAGARTLVIAVAPYGGQLPSAWVAVIEAALAAGLDVAAGLHSRLVDEPRLALAARTHERRLFDIRQPQQTLPVGTGRPRTGRRLLTVGTDTCVGKMFTALAIEQDLHRRNRAATFRATGQTGIFIAGGGICVDAVVADFISGSVEVLAPDNAPDHWDIIEGQGSLFHPGYAGVSLGLLHGAQAEALVLCHEAGRPHTDGLPEVPLPTIEDCLDLNLRCARRTNPNSRFVGIALNTRRLDPAAAESACRDLGAASGLPTVDPVRHGVGPIVDRLLAN